MEMEKQIPSYGRAIPRFYVVCLICAAAALSLILIACAVVRELLAEYEDAQPKYVAAEVFETYFSPIDYDRLLAEARYDAGFASVETVREYLETEIGGAELTWSAGSSGGQTDVKYIVRAGRKQIGSIWLTAAPETTRHGFQSYVPSYVELNLRPEAIPGGVLTFTAPADYTVTLDGVRVTAEQRTGSYLDPDALEHYLEGVSGLEYAVYTLPGLKELPREISVKNPFGGESEVSFDREASAYFAGPAYSQELADEHSEFIISAIEGYAAYMQQVPGTSFNGIRKYFDPDSSLYRAISAAGRDLWMVTTPTGNEFQDVEVDQFYAHSEDIFSCHISFTQVLLRSRDKDYDAVDMYVFVRRTGSGWRVYEWYNNI